MDKIASLICKFLDIKDLVNLAFTNSCIYKSLEQHLYSDLEISCRHGLSRLIHQIHKNQNISFYTRKIGLYGSCVESLDIGDLDFVLSKCVSLEEFYLGENGFHLSNQLIKSLSVNNPGLMIISIRGCPISDKCMNMFSVFSRLKRLDLRFTNVSMDFIQVLEFFPGLEELDLSGANSGIGSDGINSNLRVLKLNNSNISSKELSRISVPRLEIFEISFSKLSCESIIDFLEKCTLITTLNISFCDFVNDKLLKFLDSRSNLREIVASGCHLITPIAVLEMIEKCGGLQLLILDSCPQISSCFITQFSVKKNQIILNLSSLQKLRLIRNESGTCKSRREVLDKVHHTKSSYSLKENPRNSFRMESRILLADGRRLEKSRKNCILKIEIKKGMHEIIQIKEGDVIKDVVDDFCIKFGQERKTDALLGLIRQKIFH